jgi:hypothetical protein
MVLWISSIVFYLLHRGDRKQNLLVLAGTILGCLLGLRTSWIRRDLHYLMAHLPLTFAFSLIGSAVLHQIGRISQPSSGMDQEVGWVSQSAQRPCDIQLNLCVQRPDLSNEGVEKHDLNDLDQGGNM